MPACYPGGSDGLSDAPGLHANWRDVQLGHEHGLEQIMELESQISELTVTLQQAEAEPQMAEKAVEAPRVLQQLPSTPTACSTSGREPIAECEVRATRCPSRHALTQWHAVEAPYECDGCGADLAIGTLLLGCEPCDWVLCAGCATRPSVCGKTGSSGRGSRRSAAFQPRLMAANAAGLLC